MSKQMYLKQNYWHVWKCAMCLLEVNFSTLFTAKYTMQHVSDHILKNMANVYKGKNKKLTHVTRFKNDFQ